MYLTQTPAKLAFNVNTKPGQTIDVSIDWTISPVRRDVKSVGQQRQAEIARGTVAANQSADEAIPRAAPVSAIAPPGPNEDLKVL